MPARSADSMRSAWRACPAAEVIALDASLRALTALPWAVMSLVRASAARAAFSASSRSLSAASWASLSAFSWAARSSASFWAAIW